MSRAQRRASDAQRRAEFSRFMRKAAGGYVSSLVDRDDPRLVGEKLLSAAVAQWRRNAGPRKATCFACGMLFGENGSGAAAFLLVQPSAALSTVSTAALCADCWANKSDEDIQHEAARALRPVLGGAPP
jgi:hypothetical protein